MATFDHYESMRKSMATFDPLESMRKSMATFDPYESMRKSMATFDPYESMRKSMATFDPYKTFSATALLNGNWKRHTAVATSVLSQAISEGLVDEDANIVDADALDEVVNAVKASFSWSEVSGSLQLWIATTVAIFAFAGEEISPQMFACLNVASALIAYIASRQDS